MCSNARMPDRAEAATASVAAQLARAIDECAAAASHLAGAAEAATHLAGTAETDLARRLASLWAILTDADPELAACTARYAERDRTPPQRQ